MAAEWSWGQWMGAWKADAGMVDMEKERLTRQEAAVGGDTFAKMKGLNVLIVGCRGTGVEAAKNLILSNVKSVTIWDPLPATVQDCGANFYLHAEDVGKPRAAQCIAQLKSLNPYCKVDVLDAAVDALPEQVKTGYAVVIVTQLLPEAILFQMNANAREKGAKFLMAINSGVTATVFSDFGEKHEITDPDGEPTETLAMSSAEIIEVGGIVKVEGCKAGDKVLVLTLASNHKLEDDDLIALDDMWGDLSSYNGQQLSVKRFNLCTPPRDMYELDTKDVQTAELLKGSTADLVTNLTKVYDNFRTEFEKAGKGDAEAYRKKHSEKNMFSRLVLVLKEGQSLDSWKSYRSGGLVNSVKKVTLKSYGSLEKTLVETAIPQMLDQEAWQAGTGCWIQIAIAAALKFHSTKGRWPGYMSEADATEFLALAKGISDARKSTDGACWLQGISFGFPSGEPMEDMAKTEAALKQYSLLFEAELTGFCAFLGGLIAQEAIKVTGKFTPIEQWLHHYDPDLTTSTPSIVADYKDTRYAYQASIIGKDHMEAVRKQNIFLVGVGALGCEYVKGIELMGACTAPGAKLIITDMDRIEVSNLSRQFLFRQPDVGSAKSITAGRIVKGWNPDLNVEALEKGVGVTSEDYFDDAFWQRLDLCWNALDNVLARKYTDRCCLWYNLPLLESGTLGTKTNSDVFLPNLTKSYNDGVEDDSNETQIAMCTLRSFPYLPLHCIEFAKKSYFEDYMEFAPQQYESFRTDMASFFEQLDSMEKDSEKFMALSTIKNFVELQKDGPITFDTCIKQAFKHYATDFITSIRTLVYQCDQIEKAKGVPFWTGTKRKPKEAPWNAAAPPAIAIEYLYAAANCYAFVFGVTHVRNRGDFEKMVIALNLAVPEWKEPDASADQEDLEGDGDKVDSAAIETLKGELYSVDVSKMIPMQAHDFEKDDDANFHIDFLTCGTNLRSSNYDIKLSDRANVKVTAGKIIPALATTTAMVCGLVDNEFLKIAMGLHKTENAVDKFYSCNINLATGSGAFNAFRPEDPISLETKLEKLPKFTSWEKVEIQGEISLEALLAELEKRYDCKVHRVFAAASDKDAIYDKIEVEKQTWTIEVRGGALVCEPEAVFGAWPNLRMCAQQLKMLPEGSNARKTFENMVNVCQKSLENVKSSFNAKFKGPVSQAYEKLMRPAEDEAKQKYFDAVFAKRPYIALRAHVTNAGGEAAELPIIKYTYRK
jgi:ubiquitin-activating enzyme E1